MSGFKHRHNTEQCYGFYKFYCKHRKNNLDQKLLLTVYRTSLESMVSYCLGVWPTDENRKHAHRVTLLKKIFIFYLFYLF